MRMLSGFAYLTMIPIVLVVILAIGESQGRTPQTNLGNLLIVGGLFLFGLVIVVMRGRALKFGFIALLLLAAYLWLK